MESVWEVSKLSPESVGSRRDRASCELCSHRRRDSTQQLSLVGVGGVYWALRSEPRPRLDYQGQK